MIRYTTKKTRVRFNLGIQRERPVSYGKFPEKKWGGLWYLVDLDVASSRNFTRGSERAVARQHGISEDVVEGPCGVSVCQDWIGASVREGECRHTVQRVAGNRASEIA